MKSLIVGDKATVARLVKRLKMAASQSEYKRIHRFENNNLGKP